MPILEAVVDNASVKRIMKASIFPLEVTVAMRVGLLVGRDVTNDHVEL